MSPTFFSTTARYRGRERAWQKKYDAHAPREGTLAPDFTLGNASGEQATTLSQYRGDRPVVLVFGSFT